eukprot:353445-Chlamydomonas_euryale.AAC.33
MSPVHPSPATRLRPPPSPATRLRPPGGGWQGREARPSPPPASHNSCSLTIVRRCRRGDVPTKPHLPHRGRFWRLRMARGCRRRPR